MRPIEPWDRRANLTTAQELLPDISTRRCIPLYRRTPDHLPAPFRLSRTSAALEQRLSVPRPLEGLEVPRSTQEQEWQPLGPNRPVANSTPSLGQSLCPTTICTPVLHTLCVSCGPPPDFFIIRVYVLWRKDLSEKVFL